MTPLCHSNSSLTWHGLDRHPRIMGERVQRRGVRAAHDDSAFGDAGTRVVRSGVRTTQSPQVDGYERGVARGMAVACAGAAPSTSRLSTGRAVRSRANYAGRLGPVPSDIPSCPQAGCRSAPGGKD